MRVSILIACAAALLLAAVAIGRNRHAAAVRRSRQAEIDADLLWSRPVDPVASYGPPLVAALVIDLVSVWAYFSWSCL